MITAQIERFAPGFRDVVVTSRCVPAARMSEHNANYVGGDIAAGAVNLWRMVARPTPSLDPYATGLDGVYLCSASTPPGPGVHGLGAGTPPSACCAGSSTSPPAAAGALRPSVVEAPDVGTTALTALWSPPLRPLHAGPPSRPA
ncbi:hypothetical protein NKG05_18595 [Oerskovia sp. M15]